MLLLAILPLSLAFPLVSYINFEVAPKTIIIPNFEEYLSVNDIIREETSQVKSNIDSTYNIVYFITLFYFIGIVFYLSRLFLSILQLFFLKKRSTKIHKNGISLIIADTSHIFSSFGWIFIPKDQINTIEAPILEHENAHIRLYHTLDLIITEIYIAFFWFNPIVYVFRRALRSIHEFQADKFVINSQIKKSAYLELLIKNLGTKSTSKLYSYFNHSLIKKRIDMITKTNSNPKKTFRYVLLTPLLFLILTAFIKPAIDTGDVIENIIEEEIKVEIPPSGFPIQNGTKENITAHYGKKFDHPKLKKNVIHQGIDIRAKIGTPIIATANGTVKLAKNKGNWGNLIVISHTDGYETWYAHLDSFDVKENQQVKAGEIIGKSGNTGLSTGPHLHYEVRLNGKNVDPIDYLK
ncbi:M23/M56 family metallopeptidase [Aquimarina litoralis]|uniref:M23/M56 family metallopeptidase n=1 Tax=Aquimarina litoralis TaxID=584605 RepID=UPI001C58C10A|nr:M23/M56 family metallopeptidase [Aquimarina litoralis]